MNEKKNKIIFDSNVYKESNSHNIRTFVHLEIKEYDIKEFIMKKFFNDDRVKELLFNSEIKTIEEDNCIMWKIILVTGTPEEAFELGLFYRDLWLETLLEPKNN